MKRNKPKQDMHFMLVLFEGEIRITYILALTEGREEKTREENKREEKRREEDKKTQKEGLETAS